MHMLRIIIQVLLAMASVAAILLGCLFIGLSLKSLVISYSFVAVGVLGMLFTIVWVVDEEKP